MDTEAPPANPTESKVPDLITSHVISYVAAVIAVSLRFLSRRMRSSPWWWDDWLVFSALISAAAWMAVMVFWLQHGLGVHYQTVSIPYDHYLKMNLLGLFIEETFYSTTTALVKLSILCFYWRLFNRSSIRLPIKITGAVVIGWLIARILTIFFHCFPLQGYWDKSVPASCGVNDRQFFLGTNTINVVMDIVLIAIPLPYIKKLHIKGSQKAIVFGMFLFGGMITVASIVTVVVCYNFKDTSPDVGWHITPIVIWAGTEINLAITCACLPSLRPILLLFNNRVRGITESFSSRSDGYSDGSSHPSFFKFSKSSASRTGKSSTVQHSTYRSTDQRTAISEKSSDLNAAEEGFAGRLGYPDDGKSSRNASITGDMEAPRPAHLPAGQDLRRYEIQVQNDIQVDVSDDDGSGKRYPPPMVSIT